MLPPIAGGDTLAATGAALSITRCGGAGLAGVIATMIGCSAASGPNGSQCASDAQVYPAPTPSYDVGAADRDACNHGPGDTTATTIGPAAPSAAALKHVIVLMRENRSFDHYLGALAPPPGQTLDVAPPDAVNPDPAHPGAMISRYHETRYCVRNSIHEWSAVHQQFDNGRLDGFVASNNDSAVNDGGGRAMGYYDESDLPLYYWLARNFAISDRYFSALLGPTHSNLMFYYCATSCGFAEGIDTNPKLATECGAKRPSIFTLLDSVHSSFKVYSDAPLTITAAAVGLGVYDPLHGIGSISDFEDDVAADQLPDVTFVEPNYGTLPLGVEDDEHPPTNPQVGQRFVFRVLDALMSHPTVWSSSAVFITWDEHGGYYDHVVPPVACVPDDSRVFDFAFDHHGFRVPLIVVSPFARSGYVSHVTADHTSITRFIEHWKGLPALTRRDANAWPLLDMFAFDQVPNPAAAPDAALAAENAEPAHVASCTGTPPTGVGP